MKLPILALAALLAVPVLPAAAQETKKEPSAKQLAARERQAKCSAEWKKAKADKALGADATWPKFWSACNKRLKGSSV